MATRARSFDALAIVESPLPSRQALRSRAPGADDRPVLRQLSAFAHCRVTPPTPLTGGLNVQCILDDRPRRNLSGARKSKRGYLRSRRDASRRRSPRARGPDGVDAPRAHARRAVRRARLYRLPVTARARGARFAFGPPLSRFLGYSALQRTSSNLPPHTETDETWTPLAGIN